jgi:hypothetical protein
MEVFELLRKKIYKICKVSTKLCHFPVFIMKFLKSEMFFMASADCIISVMIPIINFIKCN